MNAPRTFLDYNAGAPLRPQALEAMLAALQAGGNPSSIHAAGRRAKAVLEGAREGLAASLGAAPQDVVFTAGASEAAHLALDGARAAGVAQLLVSAVEHDAVFAHAAALGARVLPVDAAGRLDLAALAAVAEGLQEPFLACVMLANNETGVIQPVAEAAAIVHAAGGWLLCDAAQGLGRLAVDRAALGADYLVVSSHKVGGPPGAGALVLGPGAPFRSPRLGGGQERGRRPGTETAPAAAGFAAAVAAALAQREAEQARLAAARDHAQAALRRLAPDAEIFGEDTPRLSNTLCFAVPGLAAETALIALDLAGVQVSSGSACSSGKVKASRVLAAMGASPALAAGALRVSLGWATREAEIDHLLSAIAPLARRSAPVQGAA
jgi:cysteine desulfurase